MSKKYLIGTEEQQAYMKDYNWNLKGYSYFEGIRERLRCFLPVERQFEHQQSAQVTCRAG